MRVGVSSRCAMTEQRYPVLETHVDPKSEPYRQNREANAASLDKLAKALAEARAGGGDKYVARHKDAGKLLPRERIELLLDRDSHFLELCALAGYEIKGHKPGASLVGGISGVECVITASEATVKGGAINEMGVRKSARLADIAERNGMPTISMITDRVWLRSSKNSPTAISRDAVTTCSPVMESSG